MSTLRQHLILLDFLFVVLFIFIVLVWYSNDQRDYRTTSAEPSMSCEEILYQERMLGLYGAEEILAGRDKQRRAIFFVAASRDGVLSGRRMCAVESAARHNPSADVYLLVLAPPTQLSIATNEALRTVTRHHQNLQILSVDLTPDDNSTIEESVALSVIERYGGMFLPLDSIVLRPLDQLDANFVCSSEGGHLSKRAFGFAKGRDGARAEVAKAKDAQATPLDVFLFSTVAEGGGELRVLPPRTFFPLAPTEWELAFEPVGTSEAAALLNDSLALHTWAEASGGRSVRVDDPEERTLLAQLARAHCPRAFWSCYTEF